jgi:threonine 3-dehydrogenase
MMALAKTVSGPGFELVDVPVPVIGRDEVLARVLRTGICGTDVTLYKWGALASRMLVPPCVVGHEFVGEIVEVGTDVGGLRPGQIVSAEAHVTCDRCARCRSGQKHLCRDARRLGLQRDGAFAEFLAVPARNVWVHASTVPLDVAAIFDAFGNAVHAADTFDLEDRSVLITGAGPVGIMTAAVALHRGAEPVVITDVSPYRLELARAVGVQHTAEANISSVVRPIADHLPGGFDVAFEMSGSPRAISELLPAVGRGGKVGVLGLPNEPVAVDWADLSQRMLTIHGISGRRVFDTWHSMNELLDQGLDPQPIITHHFAAQEYERAFAAAADGTAGKVILTWSEKTGTVS